MNNVYKELNKFSDEDHIKAVQVIGNFFIIDEPDKSMKIIKGLIERKIIEKVK